MWPRSATSRLAAYLRHQAVGGMVSSPGECNGSAAEAFNLFGTLIGKLHLTALDRMRQRLSNLETLSTPRTK